MRPAHFRYAITSAFLVAALVTALLPAMPALAKPGIKVSASETSTSIETQRVVSVPEGASHVALKWKGPHDAQMTVAFGTSETAFGEELPVGHSEESDHDEDGETTYSAVLWTSGERYLRITTDQPIPEATVIAIDAQADKAFVDGPIAVVEGAMDQPAIIPRSGWGADEGLRFDSGGNETWPPSFSPMQKAIVHHTAGRNNDPHPAATVRAIYYMYAISRDYGDIGYNFLIDEAGRIYEGRYSRQYASGETPTGEDLAGNVVRGAHARDYNDANVGIVLLGTFQNRQPTTAARNSLEKLLAWKLERHDIDPMGSSTYVNPVLGNTKFIPNISGHRQVNATACPGNAFFPKFADLRRDVRDRIAATTGAGNDNEAPGVNSIKPLLASSGSLSIPFGLIFDEPIQGLEESDFDLGGTSSGWFVDSITGAGSTYTVNVAGSSPSDGTVELTLPSDSVTDLAGHNGPNGAATGQAVYAHDGNSPTVGLYHTPHKTYHRTVKRTTRGDKVYYFDLTATFSEPVTGFTSSDMIIGGTSHAADAWQAGFIFGSGARYGFSISSKTWANGTLTFSLPAGAVTDLAGNPVQASNLVSLVLDRSAPTTTRPTATLQSGVGIGNRSRVHLDWSGTDVGPAGISSYDVAKSTNGGPFKVIKTGLSASQLDVWPKPGKTHRYKVRARDRAGNVGAWRTGPTLRPGILQQSSATFGGSTGKVSSSSYSGGSERHLSTVGSYARLRTTARSLSFITTRGPNRGSVQVWIDGALAATINLNAATPTYRYVAFTRTWSAVGVHRIKVVAIGPSGSARIDVDAFGVIR